jgi:hypothetical protein
MRIPKTPLRTLIIAGAALFVALVGGVWLTGAQGALAAPGDPVRAYDVNDPFNSADDTVLADNLVYWFGYYAEYEPCAFFATKWASPLRVSLETNEACREQPPENLDVLCIGPAEGVTATTVDNVTVDLSGNTPTLSFDSRQDGHCMVTSVPVPAGAEDGYILPALLGGDGGAE